MLFHQRCLLNTGLSCEGRARAAFADLVSSNPLLNQSRYAAEGSGVDLQR